MAELTLPEAPEAAPVILKKTSRKKGTQIAPVVFVGNDESVSRINHVSSIIAYDLDENDDPRLDKRQIPITRNFHFPYVCTTQEQVDELEDVLERQMGNPEREAIKRLDEVDSAHFLKHNKQVQLYQSSSAARAAVSRK